MEYTYKYQIWNICGIRNRMKYGMKYGMELWDRNTKIRKRNGNMEWKGKWKWKTVASKELT
jgi:hypothetical protein